MGLVSAMKGPLIEEVKILYHDASPRRVFLCLLLSLFMHIMSLLRMGLVSRIKGPPFHGDKILYHDASPRFLSCH